MSIPAGQEALIEAIAAGYSRPTKHATSSRSTWESLLTGAVIAQLFTYWRFVPTDPKHVVVLVLLASAVSLAASIVILLWMVHLWVWSFGVYTTFSEVAWLLRYMYLEITVVALVHIFYIDRACKLYRHWWPAVVIGPFTLTRTAIGSVCARIGFGSSKYVTPDIVEDPKNIALAYSWLSCTLVADVLITVTVIYGLYSVQTGWRHTDSKLRKLMILCFESQVPALIISAVSVVAWNKSFEIAIAFVMISTKVYTLGVLVTLNIRAASSTGGTHVSAPSALNLPQSRTYPMNSFSHNQESHPQANAQSQQSWETTSSDRTIAAEAGLHDKEAEIEGHSTTTLNFAGRV